ncbi:MAG TPA: thiamine phosphate synthase [Bryobacteraceae bacterium]|nr:thiamine phosphate synthase [Bryobacteraceae bacterium]
MSLPRIYPILDTETLKNLGLSLENAAAGLLEGGATLIQLRHKGHWGREIYASAQTVAGLCRQAGAQLIINDRADFAMLLGAGLHLGQNDLPPRDGRNLLGNAAMIGYSCHSAGQISIARGEPVDYVALGPIFPTASKRDPDPVVGVDQLRFCRTLLERPLVAIGGITLENAVGVLRAGADSVAILSGVIPQPASAHAVRSRMEQWRALAAAV